MAVMRRTREESGFTLVETLMVSILFMIVLGATLASMNAFERLSRDNSRMNDHAERTRMAVERASRQLRNLASRPVTGKPTIARAEPTDFVFQTSDPTRTWVRMCTAPGTNGSATLWTLASNTLEPPSVGACPGTGKAASEWPTASQVTNAVTNQADGRAIPVFTYRRNCTTSVSPTCATTDLGSITSVNFELRVDDNRRRKPAETSVSSGVYLRNQNEAPLAKFRWSVVSVMERKVMLNGSDSVDPEGRTLRYYWFKGSTAPSFACGQPPTNGTVLNMGVTATYTFASTEGASGTLVPFTLVVCDPGDVRATFTDSVQIP